jgi:hypothetical protein
VVGSRLTRFSSMLQNILETFVQTRQTEGEDSTSTHFNPHGKGRPVLHASPTRVGPDLLYCVPNHAFITSTKPTAPSLLSDSKKRCDAGIRSPLLWAANAALWLVSRDCEAVNATPSASPRLQLCLPSISSSRLSYQKLETVNLLVSLSKSL